MSLTAEDRMQMIELVARYNHAIDSRDGEAWADTFTHERQVLRASQTRCPGTRGP